MDPTTSHRTPSTSLVRNALDRLPDEAAALVAHIAVVVREQPEPGEATRAGQLLLGTFRGIAHTRSAGGCPVRCPTSSRSTGCRSCAVCRSADEVAPRVLKVLGHEVGHALGLSEGQLRASAGTDDRDGHALPAVGAAN